jgi:hypothetical protein
MKMSVNYVNEVDQTIQGGFDLLQLGTTVIGRVFNIMLANKLLTILIVVLVLSGGKLAGNVGKFFGAKIG